MEQTITLDLDSYIECLEARRREVEPRGWTIPDCVWDYYLDMLRDGCYPTNTSPSYVVDNLAVNGDYGDFDNYKNEGESDEDFINREWDNCLDILIKDRFIIYSL